MQPKTKRRPPRRKQRAVINDLLKSELTEHEVLEKHKISPWRYRKWLKNGLFTYEFNSRVDAALRQRPNSLLVALSPAGRRKTRDVARL